MSATPNARAGVHGVPLLPATALVLSGALMSRIQDTALVAAATLSHRYITDRFLPDKAIDLVDEAASRIKMELDSKPTELDQLDRQILQLQIERTSLAKEKDEASRERLRKLDTEHANLKEQSAALTAQWQNEKTVINAASVIAASKRMMSDRRATERISWMTASRDSGLRKSIWAVSFHGMFVPSFPW